MRFAVAFVSVCLVALTLAEDLNDKKTAIVNLCKQKLSASDAVASIANTKKEPENAEENCFLECVYEKLGLIKDGKLNADGANALAKVKFGDNLDKIQKSDAVFKKCKSEYVAANEKCDLGKYVRKCLINNDSKETGFFGSN